MIKMSVERRIRILRHAAACVREGSARMSAVVRLEISKACSELADRLEREMNAEKSKTD